MKKIILIVAIVLVAVVGLTSFNGKEVKKENGDRLIAQVKTESPGEPIIKGGTKKDN
ncbi:hypothetical protein [Flavobacterium pallidum]|uniref:hypothetical protein n=1 Tax=Flavobacterium pallidum TaxID=2172098 RepID=UPI0015E82AEA|nr:hypothetical protein [Flavobacterium pallidum]